MGIRNTVTIKARSDQPRRVLLRYRTLPGVKRARSYRRHRPIRYRRHTRISRRPVNTPSEAADDLEVKRMRWTRHKACIAAGALVLAGIVVGCAHHLISARAERAGIASFYSDALQGRPTACGEPYDATGLTAAHKTLPLGTRVRVTNRSNGRTVVVRINDRGPFVPGRVIDLSRAAAARLGMTQAGLTRVELEVLDRDPGVASAD
jgi:rare lipoprotein A